MGLSWVLTIRTSRHIVDAVFGLALVAYSEEIGFRRCARHLFQIYLNDGKSHRPYEFGVKVSVATPVKPSGGGQFVAHVAARYRSEPVSCYFVCSMPRDGMNVCLPS